MERFFLSALFFFISFGFPLVLQALEHQEKTPEFLYKIISTKDWDASQNRPYIILPGEDQLFIHLAKADQVERVAGKYWGNFPEFVVLKIDASKMTGQLVLEKNFGGDNWYYHLYNGGIPLEAVVDYAVIKQGEKAFPSSFEE